MAVRSKEELMASIGALTTENLTDMSITLLEDVADTLDHFGNVDKRLADLDASWRQKYKERFLQKPENEPENEMVVTPKIGEGNLTSDETNGDDNISFDELFE